MFIIALTYVFTAFVVMRETPIAANGGLIHRKCTVIYLRDPASENAPACWLALLVWDRLICYPAGRHGRRFPFVIVGAMGYAVGAITVKDTTATERWDAIAVGVCDPRLWDTISQK